MWQEEELVSCQKCGITFRRKTDERWKRVCLSCYIENKRREESRPTPSKPPPTPAFDPEMLRRLIHLCHPDKHGGSQASLIATQWLLKQKK